MSDDRAQEAESLDEDGGLEVEGYSDALSYNFSGIEGSAGYVVTPDPIRSILLPPNPRTLPPSGTPGR